MAWVMRNNGFVWVEDAADMTQARRSAGAIAPSLSEAAPVSAKLVETCAGPGNQIFGTDNNETITGTVSNDYIRALGGDDTVWGGDGCDTLNGGAGYDLLLGQQGSDGLFGADGNDLLIGDGGLPSGPTKVYTLPSDAFEDYISGGAGNDRIYGDLFYIVTSGVPGQYIDPATIGMNDYLEGGDGDDEIWGQGGDDRLFGDADADTIYGGDGADILRGGTGNDYLFANDEAGFRIDSDNFLYGEAGDDLLAGSAGHDCLYGGDGNDVLWGGRGSDYIEGGAGNDTIRGDGMLAPPNGALERDNTLHGNDGDDTLYAGSGADSLFGDAGNDTLHGGRYQSGGAGNDTHILSGTVDVWTGEGADFIRLTASPGGKLLSGGEHLTQPLTSAVIHDFSAGDRLLLDWSSLPANPDQNGFPALPPGAYTGPVQTLTAAGLQFEWGYGNAAVLLENVTSLLAWDSVSNAFYLPVTAPV